MKIKKNHTLRKILCIILTLSIIISISSASFAITIHDEVVWFFDMLAAQDQALRTDIVKLIATDSGGGTYILDAEGALGDGKIDDTVTAFLGVYDTMHITPRPSAAAVKNALVKLKLLNTEDPAFTSAMLTQAVKADAFLIDVQILMKKFMDVLAKQNQAVRLEIVGMIANKPASTYELDTTVKLGTDYNATVGKIVSKLGDIGISEPGKRILVEVGLYGLMKFNAANPAIASYMLTEMTQPLQDVTTPLGLGSIQTKIESYTISYKIFVNLLFKISDVKVLASLEKVDKAILIYEKNKSKNIIEDSTVPLIFDKMISFVSDSPTEQAKLKDYKAKIEVLLDLTNKSPEAEKLVLVEDLRSLGLLKIDETMPSTPTGGGDTSGSSSSDTGGGNPPALVAITTEGVPYSQLSQTQLLNELDTVTADYSTEIVKLTGDIDAADRARTAASIANSIIKAESIIALLTDKNDILAKAEEIISKMSGSVNLLNQYNESSDIIRNELIKLAKIAQKMLASNILAQGTSASDSYNLTGSALTGVIDSIAASKAFTDKLNTALAKLVIPTTVHNEFSIGLSGKNTTGAGITAPAGLLKAAADAKIDDLSFNLGVADFKFAPNAFTVPEGASFTLKAEQLDKEKVIPALSQAAKDSIGSSPVYDLKALVGTQQITFGGKVTVSIPVRNNDPDSMTAYYMDSMGQLQNIGGFYDSKTNSFVFSVEHFSNYLIKNNAVAFTDVPKTYWASSVISSAAAKEILKGVGNNKFQPEGKMTKAQFVSMLIRAIKPDAKTLSAVAMNFTDVMQTEWYYKDIETAVKAGLVTNTATAFNPGQEITRLEASVILGRALVKYKMGTVPKNPGNILNKFTDGGTISKDAAGFASLVVNKGIITGSANKFLPAGSTTRAQAAAIIIRYLAAD